MAQPAGPNQHHIPQFLQRAFGIKSKGKPKDIWTYKADTGADRGSISSTAAEDYFYSFPSEDGSETLDDKIGVPEDLAAKFHFKLRSEPLGAVADADKAATLVAHLAPRSSHLRSSVAFGVYQLVTGARDLFTGPGNLERMMGLDKDEPNALFSERFREGIEKSPEIVALGLPMSVLERMAFYLAREQFDTSKMQAGQMLAAMLSYFTANSPPLVRESHNKALLDMTEGKDIRRDLLSDFSWTLEDAPAEGAILPDCVALAYMPDEPLLPFMFAGQHTQAVVMPISTTKLLVGYKDGAPVLDLSKFNMAAAACSHDFFLANANTENYRSLASTIGSRSAEYFDDAMRESVDSFMPQRDEAVPEEEPFESGWKVTDDEVLSQYEINCFDITDSAICQRIIDQVSPLVSALSRIIPLSRLDGLTFAIDYAAALKAIDRGREDLPKLTADEDQISMPYGRTVPIIKDGQVQARLAFNAPLTECILSDDEGHQDLARHMIVHELSQTAMIGFVERAVPNTLLQRIGDESATIFYNQVHEALHGYAAARISAYFGDQMQLAGLFRNVLVSALHSLHDSVTQARTDLIQHRNIDLVMEVALPAVSRALYWASRLLGHCESTGISILGDDDSLREALEKLKLVHWLGDYGRDLQNFYARIGAWRSVQDFLSFNRHVERLLWAVAVFPWNSPEGFRIEIGLPQLSNA